MAPGAYNEDTLVQQTTANYLEQQLRWISVLAYNNEDFGPDSLLGRASDREVVLTRPLREKLVALNPGLPDIAYDDAVRQITATVAAQTMAATNREKYAQLRDGVQVTFRDENGERVRKRLRVSDCAFALFQCAGHGVTIDQRATDSVIPAKAGTTRQIFHFPVPFRLLRNCLQLYKH